MSPTRRRSFLLGSTSTLALVVVPAARPRDWRDPIARAALIALIAFDPEAVRIDASKSRRSKMDKPPPKPKQSRRPRRSRSKTRRALADFHRKARGEQ